ncbi:MAG: phytoene desaturase family protein [Parabacteroides sp.]
MKKQDVIIIGSGLGGLLCAYLLARAGKQVLVLEQGRTPGGCMQSYQRQGLTYDTGLHYVGGLTEGQPLQRLFSYMGLMELPWQRMQPEGFDRVTLGERTFWFDQGYEAFARRMADYFPAERSAIRRYVELLQMTSRQELDLLRPGCDSTEQIDALFARNAYDYLKEQFRDPFLIDILSGTSLKMELRKETLPLFTFLHGNSSYIESSWRLRGGGSQLVEMLCQGIRAQGGEILCRQRVTNLIERCGQLAHVRCSNGECYEADQFISDLHPTHTTYLVKRSTQMKMRYHQRINTLSNTMGMFTVSLTVRPRTYRYTNWNRYIYTKPDVWQPPAADGTIDRLLISCRVPDDQGEYLRQIDLLTPSPWSLWKAYEKEGRHLPDSPYLALKRQMATDCIEIASRFFPELQRTAKYHASTPLTWQRYTSTPEGSAYGLRKDCNNPLLTFLSPRTPIPNLLMTGQSLVLHGVHGVAMTALLTCAELLGKEHIWSILKD